MTVPRATCVKQWYNSYAVIFAQLPATERWVVVHCEAQYIVGYKRAIIFYFRNFVRQRSCICTMCSWNHTGTRGLRGDSRCKRVLGKKPPVSSRFSNYRINCSRNSKCLTTVSISRAYNFFFSHILNFKQRRSLKLQQCATLWT